MHPFIMNPPVMNQWIRWAKFNLVGAMGVAVQLASLALFNKLAPGHYLCAAAAAIELTLLHNFTWHLLYTWRDRRDRSTLLSQLVRFHLSNGLVSMTGNLSLMRLLVHATHLPLLAANCIAILCCSAVNFILSNYWAFRRVLPDGATTRGAVTL
jgi:putative flippase GtrA